MNSIEIDYVRVNVPPEAFGLLVHLLHEGQSWLPPLGKHHFRGGLLFTFDKVGCEIAFVDLVGR